MKTRAILLLSVGLLGFLRLQYPLTSRAIWAMAMYYTACRFLGHQPGDIEPVELVTYIRCNRCHIVLSKMEMRMMSLQDFIDKYRVIDLDLPRLGNTGQGRIH